MLYVPGKIVLIVQAILTIWVQALGHNVGYEHVRNMRDAPNSEKHHHPLQQEPYVRKLLGPHSEPYVLKA